MNRKEVQNTDVADDAVVVVVVVVVVVAAAAAVAIAMGTSLIAAEVAVVLRAYGDPAAAGVSTPFEPHARVWRELHAAHQLELAWRRLVAAADIDGVGLDAVAAVVEHELGDEAPDAVQD